MFLTRDKGENREINFIFDLLTSKMYFQEFFVFFQSFSTFSLSQAQAILGYSRDKHKWNGSWRALFIHAVTAELFIFEEITLGWEIKITTSKMQFSVINACGNSEWQLGLDVHEKLETRGKKARVYLMSQRV